MITMGKLKEMKDAATAKTPKAGSPEDNRNMDKVKAEAKKRATKMLAEPPAYKKGGKVKKTGMALVHKGEKVMTQKQVRKQTQKRKGSCK